MLLGAESSGNRYVDIGDGAFHLVPDEATANALGLDWNDVFWYGSDDDLPGSIGDPLSAPSEQSPAQSAQPAASIPPGRDVITPDGSVYRYDGNNGAWRHIPDVATANKMGIDWQNLFPVDSVPQPTTSDWPSVAPVLPKATSVSVPTAPVNETMPKSLGQALQAYISGGSTPAEAAIQAEALRASLVRQGVSSVTPAQLLQDAQQVAVNIAPAPAQAPPPDQSAFQPPSDESAAPRQLESARPSPSYIINVPGNLFNWTLPDQQNGNPTAKSSWRSLIKTLANDTSQSVVSARASSSRFMSKVR